MSCNDASRQTASGGSQFRPLEKGHGAEEDRKELMHSDHTGVHASWYFGAE